MVNRIAFLVAPVSSSKASVFSSPHAMPQLALREYEVRASAPFAWVTQSVLQEIAHAAATGEPEQTYGTLFGHWVVVNREVVITNWRRPGSLDAEPRADRGSSDPIGAWLRGPDGRALKGRHHARAARRVSAGVEHTGLMLVLTHEGANGWAPRLWLNPARRSPLARLRRPLRMRLRTFVPPGEKE